MSECTTETDSFCFGGQASSRHSRNIYKFPRKVPSCTPNSLDCHIKARVIADHPPYHCNRHKSLCAPNIL